MSELLDLVKNLISRPSVTPEDAGCQSLIADRLQALGFNVTHLPYHAVKNLWARRGQSHPFIVFAGHTDVVPPGNEQDWQFPPFTPTEYEGFLYGRGAADMKGGVAAMLIACERFIQQYPQHSGSIGFLITSDEEGPAIHGTKQVLQDLKEDKAFDYCLLGEPSSEKQVADAIKVGRRGSLNGFLTVYGVQGHVAYPHIASNPIHLFAPVLQQLCREVWDEGDEFFPPTSFQISNISAGTGANNVIPGLLEVKFNFRYNTQWTAQSLQERVLALVKEAKLDYHLSWEESGQPFVTSQGKLVSATQAAISEVCGYTTTLSTSGGTSDGRFIAPLGVEVIELGPVNASIHKVNECVNIEELERLTAIYMRVLEKLLLV